MKDAYSDQRFSEVDLIPTIFSILNNKSYKNSFEPILKGEKVLDYDNCQMLVQPHLNLSYSNIKYPDKYVFLFEDKEIHYFNLETDPYEQIKTILETDVNVNYFLNKYGCDKYKNNKDYNILYGSNHLQ